MAAAMSVPVVALATATGSLVGLLPHTAALRGMNVLMWVAILGAMLFRWPDYAQHRHGQRRPQSVNQEPAGKGAR
jgi:hypothetical protein